MESADITNRAVQRSSIQQVIYLNHWNWDAGVMDVELRVPVVSNNKTYKKFKIIYTGINSKSKSGRRNLVGIIASYRTWL